MKLKGRIAVAFTVVLVFPLLLISIAVYTIVHVRFDVPGQPLIFDQNTISEIANPVEYVNRRTRGTYNEVSLCMRNTPERLTDKEYLDGIEQRLSVYKSSIVVAMNGKVTYNGNEEIFEKAKVILGRTAAITDSADNGIYFGDKGILVKKMTRSVSYGTVASVFILTDLDDFVSNLKKSLVSFAVCVVLIMLLTAGILAIWLYGAILRPINYLRHSTEKMRQGSLDTPITPVYHDEIGDLCTDLDKMREYMKDLLADKNRHERDTRDLIVNMSHDLKTPLTSIRGYSEGLLEGIAKTPEKQDKYVRTIYTKARDMTDLIDELSTYAKIDTNTIPYNFRLINIYDYLEETITELRTDMEIQNMDLVFFPYADRSIDVIADPEQLRRVINNIISNSIKYRDPTKKGIISIRTLDADDSVRIEMIDNGLGIESKSLSHVFERFYRADESRNSRIGGSGLGLAIVKKIIDESGGRIWAESEPGVGTTMVFTLRKSFIRSGMIRNLDPAFMLEGSENDQKKTKIRRRRV